MRLIDADKIKIEDFYDRVDMYECMEAINEQPTAYDVEAVVRELEEELKYHVKGELRCEDKGYEAGAERHRQKVIAYDTAIEIVKRGGVNGQTD